MWWRTVIAITGGIVTWGALWILLRKKPTDSSLSDTLVAICIVLSDVAVIELAMALLPDHPYAALAFVFITTIALNIFITVAGRHMTVLSRLE